jgi:hypothetical protein
MWTPLFPQKEQVPASNPKHPPARSGPFPSPAPAGPDWVHEIKHDGYRLQVRRDGDTVLRHAVASEPQAARKKSLEKLIFGSIWSKKY